MSLAEAVEQVYLIPLVDILEDSDFNCRGKIAPIDVVDLAKSIDTNGMQYPILVQPWDKVPGKKYRILSGHRRFMAHRVLDKPAIKAIVREVADELAARKINLEENLERKNLNILQEARALVPYIKAGFKEGELAAYINQSRGWVQARVALLNLPEDVQMEAAAGFITQDQVKQLATLVKTPDKLYAAVKKIKMHKINGAKGVVRAVPKKTNALKKRLRDREEIFTRMEEFMGITGPAFFSRCLAWAAGEISDFELYRDFKEYCRDQGIEWEIPQSAITDLLS